jgi:hypothetical protein
MPSVLIPGWRGQPKNPYIKTPWGVLMKGRWRNTKPRNRGCTCEDWRGKRCRIHPRLLLQPLQHHKHRHHDKEGVVHLWTMGLWQYLVLSLSYASKFRHHMSCPTWLWFILCNSYVVDLYFIGWSMGCDMLLCFWCMSICILLPHSLLLVLIQHVCENAKGGWCVLDGVTR